MRVAALGLLVVTSQFGLLMCAKHLCELRSEYRETPNVHVGKGWWMPVCNTTFHGYPVAWHEERQIVWGPVLDFESNSELNDVLSRMDPDYRPIEPVGSNWMIPLLLYLLAFAIPPLFAWRVVWGVRLVRRIPRAGKPRWAKILTVLVCSASFGLLTALLDVLSTPSHSQEYTSGFGAIPFDHEPGDRLWEYTEPVQRGEWTISSMRRHPDWIQWLRRQRSELLPVEPEEWLRQFTDLDRLRREWHRRTVRTQWFALIGIVLATLLLRPWRRSTHAAPLPFARPAGTVGTCRD
ncbi:MAG: hypothetical protein U0791_27710 [Gemmataceae bacterium]